MKLNSLLKALSHFWAPPSALPLVHPRTLPSEQRDVEIQRISTNSKEVSEGTLFIAQRGTTVDSHRFLKSAVENGASVLVVERPQEVGSEFKGVVVVVDEGRRWVGPIASVFNERPSHRLFTIGVTGTNGKTTSTLMIERLFSDQNCPTGVIGTIDHHIGDKVWKTDLTTGDPITIQSRL